MKKVFNRYFDYLVPASIFLLACCFSFIGVGQGIINYIDHGFPFSFIDYLNKLRFCWNDYIYLGSNHSTNLVNGIPYYIFFAFFEFLGFDYVFLNRLEHIFPIFFLVYFSYLFLVSLSVEKISNNSKLLLLLISTFAISNISISSLFLMGLTQGIFALSGVPLILFSIIEYGKSRKKYFLFSMAIGMLMISSFNLPYNSIFIIFIFLMGLALSLNKNKLEFNFFSLFILSWLLLNLYWILPMFYSIFIMPPFNMKDVISNTKEIKEVMLITAPRYTIDQISRLGINFNLVKIQNNDNSLLSQYFSTPIYIIMSSFFVIGIFFWHTIFKKYKNNLILDIRIVILIFLIFIFLAKGINQPLGDIYLYFFENTTFFKIFRDSLKWIIIPIFSIMILATNIILDKNKKFTWLYYLIILFFSLSLFPWFYNGMMGKFRAYSVPEYYFDFLNYYNYQKNIKDKRALILGSVVGPTSFEFDYEDKNKKRLSNNIIKFISPIPTVDLFSNGGGSSFEELKSLYKNLKKTDEDIENFIELGITHIINQKDIINSEDYIFSDKYLKKINFGKIDVYEIKKRYTLPHIFLSNSNIGSSIEFKKINSSKYKIKIKKIKNLGIINFLYTFDNNWIIRIDTKSNFSCDIANSWRESDFFYSSTPLNNTKECYMGEESMYKDFKDYFFGQGKNLNLSHNLLRETFNSWDLKPDYIKNNFPKEYYEENLDGSIDVELTLFFKPQVYFYLGLLISVTTLLGCVGYIGYDFVKRRRLKIKIAKKDSNEKI